MAKDIVTKAEILGGEIDVRANFGQTVKVTVSPDPYMGDTEVTPSDQTQVLATKKKFVQDDITVLPAPTETLLTTENGQFTPSDGMVGFSEVTVDVEPALESLNVTENGLYLPESGADGFDRVSVDVPVPSGSTTITQNGTYNVEQYASAVVNVPSAEWTTEGIADGSEPNGIIDLGDVTSVLEYAFYKRKEILSITAKHATVIGNAAFTGLTKMSEIHLPRITGLPTSVLGECHSLTVVYFPSVTSSTGYVFSGCTNLHTAIFCKLQSMASTAFNGCRLLKTLVLGNSAVCACNNINNFNGTPFASGGSGGDIYIPKALYDHLGDGTNMDYLSNPRWNTLNGNGTITWHPIEGSKYETYMPGGAKYEEEMALT